MCSVSIIAHQANTKNKYFKFSVMSYFIQSTKTVNQMRAKYRIRLYENVWKVALAQYTIRAYINKDSIDTKNQTCATCLPSSYLNKYDHIKKVIFSTTKNNIEFTVDTSKNFADKKNHIIIIIQAKNNPYDVTKLFTFHFNDISQTLYTSIQVNKTSGINHKYHNHIAKKYAINILIHNIATSNTTLYD